jgi:hypothetical protein
MVIYACQVGAAWATHGMGKGTGARDMSPSSAAAFNAIVAEERR